MGLVTAFQKKLHYVRGRNVIVQKWHDPIVEEVRKARAELMEETGDLETLFKMLKAGEARHPERIVRSDEIET